MKHADILIVEDERKIRALLADYVSAAGMNSISLERGDQVLPLLEKQPVDLILLDLMLPGMDGKTLCRRIRSFSSVPIIMLTARVEELDILAGLELGADDYICKPFSPGEVVARIRTVLRRARNDFPASVIKTGPIRLDRTAREVFVRHHPLQLTPSEFDILKVMMEQPNQVFSRRQLVKKIQGYEYEGYDRTIDSHIKNLRKKIASFLPQKKVIAAVYGAGYKLDLSAWDSASPECS